MSTSQDLKYKIGQMLIMGFDGTRLQSGDDIVQSILNQEIGGVILFDYNFQTKTYQRNIQNPAQLKALTTQLQQFADEAAMRHHRQPVPLIVSIDYEGGQVNRLKETYGFPPTVSADAIGQGSIQEAQHQAARMANTLAEAGINMNCAPSLDVNVNPDNPIIGKLGRSFSSDPATVTHYAAYFANACCNKRIASVYKHFPGHGSSTGDTHAGFVDISETWQPSELAPYQQLISQTSCPALVLVMMAHVVHRDFDPSGTPASLSYAMTTTLLRQQLGYGGAIITDDMQMKAITNQYGLEDAVIMAVNAGVDLLVFGNQLVPTPQSPQEIIDIIYQAVTSGLIPEQRIHESYERIAKIRMNLMTLNSSTFTSSPCCS